MILFFDLGAQMFFLVEMYNSQIYNSCLHQLNQNIFMLDIV